MLSILKDKTKILIKRYSVEIKLMYCLTSLAAMGGCVDRELNQRLDQARQQLKPLALGRLTIPAPRTYAIGGGSAGPRRQRASASVSGEVSKANYDALIKAAGRLPGVSLGGFTSLAASGSEETVQA